MKHWLASGFVIAVLAAALVWPLLYTPARDNSPGPAMQELPEAGVAPGHGSSLPKSSAGPAAAGCPGCAGLERLARRLRTREEGAARRFEAAANRLSRGSAETGSGQERRQLELALRRAQDDKRGAAVFRAAVLEALAACRAGAGCGEVALAAAWEEGCPPEHPDLGRETKRLATVIRMVARKASACAAAACPEIDCARQARMSRWLAEAGRGFRALEKGVASMSPGAAVSESIPALLEETGDWRGRVAALFLGGSDPSAQIHAAAEAADALASRLAAAHAPAAEPASASRAHGDPWWRLQVLSIRLSRMSAALKALAAATGTEEPGRDAKMSHARRQAADAFRDLLVTQMRLGVARETAEALPAGKPAFHRCDRRRRREIARARGQIAVLRAALERCAHRAACRERKNAGTDGISAPGLDPVSAERLRIDRSLDRLTRLARRLEVRAQEPAGIDTVRPRYQSGEAVSVRIDLRSTACMADKGAWVGLFAGNAPRLSGGESTRAAIRRLNLRGRPWEEVFFEAPERAGRYEVRTHVSERRGGGITGLAVFEVVPRAEGCRGFTGTWKTNFGRLQITVRDSEARGSYKREGAWRAGFLTGKVNGRVLLGQWQSELGGGGTRLVLSEDGKSLKGTWSHFRDEFAGTGIWKGSCAGPVKPLSGPDSRQ